MQAAPTPYPELNRVLEELVTRVRQILEHDFVGAYLQGSFAVGDFDPHSDVDFIVVTQDELTSRQVDRLQVMHDQVYQLDSEWAKHLEGSYFPTATLRDPGKCGLDPWYLDHGARDLVRSDHRNTLLVRWVVRERGVTLAGPSPARRHFRGDHQLGALRIPPVQQIAPRHGLCYNADRGVRRTAASKMAPLKEREFEALRLEKGILNF